MPTQCSPPCGHPGPPALELAVSESFHLGLEESEDSSCTSQSTCLGGTRWPLSWLGQLLRYSQGLQPWLAYQLVPRVSCPPCPTLTSWTSARSGGKKLAGSMISVSLHPSPAWSPSGLHGLPRCFCSHTVLSIQMLPPQWGHLRFAVKCHLSLLGALNSLCPLP